MDVGRCTQRLERRPASFEADMSLVGEPRARLALHFLAHVCRPAGAAACCQCTRARPGPCWHGVVMALCTPHYYTHYTIHTTYILHTTHYAIHYTHQIHATHCCCCCCSTLYQVHPIPPRRKLRQGQPSPCAMHHAEAALLAAYLSQQSRHARPKPQARRRLAPSASALKHDMDAKHQPPLTTLAAPEASALKRPPLCRALI